MTTWHGHNESHAPSCTCDNCRCDAAHAEYAAVSKRKLHLALLALYKIEAIATERIDAMTTAKRKAKRKDPK
jgi:hypothetical protein